MGYYNGGYPVILNLYIFQVLRNQLSFETVSSPSFEKSQNEAEYRLITYGSRCSSAPHLMKMYPAAGFNAEALSGRFAAFPGRSLQEREGKRERDSSIFSDHHLFSISVCTYPTLPTSCSGSQSL